MNDLHELTRDIVETCLADALITDADRAILAEYREQLLGIEDDLVRTFYDTLYAHPSTAAVFHDGEREEREQTLRGWWRRTVTSDLGPDYLEWIAFLGLVHIRRGVKSPMILTMFQVVRDVVSRTVFTGMSLEKGVPLGIAISHLQTTVGAVMAEAYTKGYVGALEGVAGLRPELSARIVGIEIAAIESRARNGG